MFIDWIKGAFIFLFMLSRPRTKVNIQKYYFKKYLF